MPHTLLMLTLVSVIHAAGPGAPGEGIEGREKEMKTLWRIGSEDRSTAGFALAPGGFDGYADDPFFGVGISDPAEHWPYVHPGPWDYWAGARSHVFTLLFGVNLEREEGACELLVDLADTHHRGPPLLEFRINGEVLERHQIPAGGPEETLTGKPETGKPHRIRVEVPVHRLRPGDNTLEIETLWGSWMLYDALRFEVPEGVRSKPIQGRTVIRSVEIPPALVRDGERLRQPVQVHIAHLDAPTEAELNLPGAAAKSLRLEAGLNRAEILCPEAESETPVTLRLVRAGRVLAEAEALLKPVRRWVVHLHHFTHLDIGYTHTQHEVERRQMEFLDQAETLIRETDGHPPESRFRWLPECLWAVESYLDAADEGKRRTFFGRVKAGRIELSALYGNALTGLYTGEELFALLDCAVRLRQEHGITIDTAMITDVPGVTWGLVPVLACSGIRYLSMSPNPSHRVGHTHVWDDRPFYWVSPGGDDRVLCWMAMGYGWFRSGLRYDDMVKSYAHNRILRHLEDLEQGGYPFELVQLRYDIGADNGPPDPLLPDTIRRWNERYAYPRLLISTPSTFFREFEARYGDRLPVVRGDFTPYWEDGAASTAADTAVNREAVETLLQAQALWVLLDRGAYPADRFYRAWRSAVLYDEHTWGAHNSISEPDSEFAREQARVKRAFALEARAAAGRLLDEALDFRPAESQNSRPQAAPRGESGKVEAVEVINTHPWPRSDLVVLPAGTGLPGDRVKGPGGAAAPSQRLSNGALAFLARDVPPMGGARFTIERGESLKSGAASAKGAALTNGLLTVRLDEETGAVIGLRARGMERDLVDREGGRALNEYLYVAGRSRENLKGASGARIEVLDRGPLVATVRVTCRAPGAPGARCLVRELRLIDGLNRLDVTNVIDKLPVREKEAVHLCFPFRLPRGEVRMDMPWAVVRPEVDQMEGACRNFFAVQRWVDLSNPECGVTWVTRDAPLVQLGAIRTDVGGSGRPDDVWLERIDPSQTLYSYVMNNYWETNYKADQGGPARFRYSIRPHAGPCDQSAAARFAAERCQPLLAVPAAPGDGARTRPSRLLVEPAGVMVTSLKPSRDGRAWMIRLYAVSGKPEEARITFPDGEARRLYASGPDEVRGALIRGTIALSPYGLATVRIEPHP